MTYKLLLIDDESWVIEQLTRLLPSLFTEHCEWIICGTAVNGHEALDKSLSLAPDILIMDIQMPGMNGLEVLEKFSDIPQHPEIIFLTGYNKFEYAQAAVEGGAAGYILKPLSAEDIRKNLLKAAQRLEQRRKIAAWHYLETDTAYTEPALAANHSDFFVKVEKIFHHTDYTKMQSILEHLQKDFPDSSPPGKSSYYRAYKYIVYIFEILSKYRITQVNHKGPLDYYAVIDTSQTNLQIFSCIRNLLLKGLSERAKLTEGSSQTTDLLTESIREYIHIHYPENLTLDFLSEIFHFHPVYLSSIFKKNTGCSPGQYITKVRIQNAKRLLSQGYKPAETALAVGYQSTKYFSDIFRKKTGFTPREYRKLFISSADADFLTPP